MTGLASIPRPTHNGLWWRECDGEREQVNVLDHARGHYERVATGTRIDDTPARWTPPAARGEP